MMVMRSGGDAIWVTALNISQEQARAHRPFTSCHSLSDQFNLPFLLPV